MLLFETESPHSILSLSYIKVETAKTVYPFFPDRVNRDPESAPQVVIGGKRSTCSQNFRPLAALEAEITSLKTIIIY